MKDILKYIPGFRTNKRWKKVIAIIGYLFMILILITPDGITNGDKVVTLIERFLLLSIPFILIANIGNIRNKLPLFRSKRKGNIIIGSLLSAICLSIILGSLPALYSNQFSQEKLVTAANLKAAKEEKENIKVTAEAKVISDAKKNADAEAEKSAKAKADDLLKSEQKTKDDVAAKLIADEEAEVIAAQKTKDASAAKVIADKKAVEDKKISDAKAIADKKISDEKAIEDKKVADAKAIEDKKVADAKAIEDAKTAEKAEYKAWVDAQFSAWDGSHTGLVDLIKPNLNDDKSFKHVETTYTDKGTYLMVYMTYRATNGFGAVILQNVTAKADYKTNTISVTSQND